MNRNRKEARRKQVLPVWTYPQARQASPYVRSIMRSLREHRLEQLGHESRAKRLAAQPGRPNRAAIIAQEDARRDAQRASERFNGDLEELQAMGVYCQDPVRGQALLPFVHEQLLAWFVFDLFAEPSLHAWRYHSDADEIRRPIAEVADKPSEWSMVL
jgi:hypothetical protein